MKPEKNIRGAAIHVKMCYLIPVHQSDVIVV